MKILGLILFLLSSQCACTAFAEDIIRGEDRFEFRYRATLPSLDGKAEIWLPLAKSDAFQTVEVERISLPTGWRKIEDRDYKNEIVALALDPADGGKAIEIGYKVVCHEKASYPAAGDTSRFLEAERLVPQNATFVSLAHDATRGKVTDMERGPALYDHVLARMKYDKSGTGWGRGDAVYACDARAGNCTDFHSYFIALARASGIPARFAIGFTIPSNTDDGKISGYHCWAEFFADGKWVPVDISEAWKNPALAAYYFGHHPANRFELSQGRDLLTDPQPASGPINFLVYPLLEIAGKPLKVETDFSFHRVKADQPKTAQAY
jgi:transglutaminase-like putative cysteine protease